MGNRKASSDGRILNIVLVILNLAMFVWIVLSWRGEREPKSALDYYRAKGYDVSMFETEENGG